MNVEQLIAAGLTEDSANAVLAMHDTDVKGLKDKNTELLGKFDGFKGEMTAKDQALEDSRKVAALAKEAQLKSDGDMEGLKKLYETQLAEQTAAMQLSTKTAQDALKSRDLGEIYSAILHNVREDLLPAAKALLMSGTDLTYGEDGVINRVIKLGDKTFDSVDAFNEAAKTDTTWMSLFKAPDTKGTGATNTTGGQAASDPDAAFQQRVKQALGK